MSASRRPATIADMTVGAHVYKGNGSQRYRVVDAIPTGTRPSFRVCRDTTTNPGTSGYLPLRTFTVEETATPEVAPVSPTYVVRQNLRSLGWNVYHVGSKSLPVRRTGFKTREAAQVHADRMNKFGATS